MTDESRTIPTQASTDLATFRIFTNGTELGTNIAIVSIAVSKAVNKIPTARLVLSDGNMAKEDFELSAGEDFVPGTEIEIHAGYHSIEDPIFKGIVIKHGIKFRSEQNSELILEMKDVSVKMTVGRKNKYFIDATDSDIIEEILSDYSDLQVDVEATDLQHKEMVQYYCTDWDFILSRADVNGQLVLVDDGTITIKAPDLSAEPLVKLFHGDNVFEFEAEMDARNQYSATKSKSWDYTNQEVIESDGEDPGITEQGNITGSDLAGIIGLENFEMQHPGQIITEELQSWANTKLLRSRLAKIQGHVQIVGFSDIKPGDIIELGGFGDRFNGKAFVSAITHTISSTTKWKTNIQFGLSEEWYAHKYDNIIERPASAILPAIHGLHYALVTNIHEDPDGEFRVRVKIPVISTEDDGVWARVATLDAGDSRGSFFRPYVDDEVIVGFINDDPRDPVILGMLHSTALPSPVEPTEDNYEKGFVTKEKVKLMFNDEKKSLTIETPNSNILLVSDDEKGIKLEDENGNKIQMNADGITIESAKDLILKASGDITIEGTNISSKASAQFKAEGSSGAEVSTSGQAVLKGSVVAIN
ncbi:MAG: type VI secretion system tip protein VgrG [Bacteroidales bacterium]|nr:MAG: type VI secretion system tip protein VgrG [Bacteroidales bacterium]